MYIYNEKTHTYVCMRLELNIQYQHIVDIRWFVIFQSNKRHERFSFE